MKTIVLMFAAFTAILGQAACSARPIASSTLAPVYTPSPEPIPEATVAGDEGLSIANLRALNRQAGRPSFALIGGFYQLPQIDSADSVTFREGQFFGGGYESLTIRGGQRRPFALTPFDTTSSVAFQSAFKELLDAGIKIVEISMADAVRVMNAQDHGNKNRLLALAKTLPSGADYLISIQQGEAEEIGPVWAGRVVSSKDGRVLAFDSIPAMGQFTIQPLLKNLIGSALRRLAIKN